MSHLPATDGATPEKWPTTLEAHKLVGKMALKAAGEHAERVLKLEARLGLIVELAKSQRAQPMGGWSPGMLAIHQIADLHNLILGET